MRLVDDVMEPFRPFVDFFVFRILKNDPAARVDRETKPKLASIPYIEVMGERGAMPLKNAVEDMAISLAQTYEGEKDGLILPKTDTPLFKHAE